MGGEHQDLQQGGMQQRGKERGARPARKRKANRRGKGEGACFLSESKGCWIGRAVVGAKPDGSPKTKEVSAKTQGKVLAKMKEAVERARRGIPADAEKITTGEYLEHWLNNVSKPSVSA